MNLSSENYFLPALGRVLVRVMSADLINIALVVVGNLAARLAGAAAGTSP